jgi:hypothetical protein
MADAPLGCGSTCVVQPYNAGQSLDRILYKDTGIDAVFLFL